MKYSKDDNILDLARAVGVIAPEDTRTDEIIDHVMIGAMTCIVGIIIICMGYITYQSL